MGIREGQGGRALRMLALVFALSAALALMKAAQSGIFLASFGRAAIPWAFAVSAVTLALLSSLWVALAARVGTPRLASAALWATIVCLVGLRALLLIPSSAVRFALYVAIEALSGVLVIQVWSVATAATDARSARRLLPIAGLGSGAAWAVGGVAVPPLVHLAGSEELLLAAPALLVLALWLVSSIARRDLPPHARHLRSRVGLVEGWREGFAFVKNEPLMRLMAAISILALVLEQLMDYQLMATAQHELGSADAISSFYGGYFGVTSLVSLLLLGLFSARLLGALGATRSLLITPAAIGAAAALALAVPTIWTSVLLRGIGRVLKQSIWSSAIEQMQTPLPPMRRAQARSAVRGVLSPTGYGIAALALAALPAGFETWWLSALVLLCACVMLALLFRRARRVYVAALHRAVDERRLLLGPGRTPSPASLDADACAALSEEILRGDAERAALAAEVLGLSNAEPAAVALLPALDHPDRVVRLTAARGLARLSNAEAAGVLAEHLVHEPDPAVRLAIVEALRDLDVEKPVVLEALRRGAEDPEPQVRAVAEVVHVSLTKQGEALGEGLLPLLKSEQLDTREAALAALTPEALPARGVQGLLHSFFSADDVASRLAVARAVVRLRHMPLLPDVVRLLKDPRTAAAAARYLVELGGGDGEDGELDKPMAAVPKSLAGSLSQLASRIARSTAPPVAQAIVLRLLAHPDPMIRRHATRALGASIRDGRRAALPAGVVRPLLTRDVRTAARLCSILAGLAHDDGVPDWEVEGPFEFLAHEVDLRVEDARQDVLALLLLRGRQRLVSAVEVGRRKPSIERDAQMAELLEMDLEPDVAPMVVPLFERLSLRERVDCFRRIGQLDEQALDDPLDSIVRLEDAHLRRAALVTYGERFSRRYPELAAEDAPLVPLFERMRFLRSVPLFHDLSGDDVFRLAELVEQKEHAAGDLVFEKGDPGEDLYLVVRGRVAVKDGEKILAELGEREFFGDLAVLDHQPRSADVVCLCDTQLLRLRGADMEELMATRPQTMREFVRVLARRLRDAGRRPL